MRVRHVWTLFRAEIEYSKYILLLFFLIPPVVVIAEFVQGVESQGFLALIVLVIMLSTWHALRIRENIDAQLSILPLPYRRVAVSRIMVVIVASFAYQGLYTLLKAASRAGDLTWMSELAGPIVVVTLFSLALIVRDRLTGTKYLYVMKASVVAGLAALAVAAIQAERSVGSGTGKPAVILVIDFIMRHRPSVDSRAFALSIGLCVLLTYLTTVSFAHRRSHIEQV